jgi:hypothetical protein
MGSADGVPNPPQRGRIALLPIVAALAVGVLIGLISPRPWQTGDGTASSVASGAMQEGTAVVPPRDDSPDGVEVFYAVPFASPPRLEFPSGLNECVVVEQSATKFKLKNLWAFERKVRWQATGQPSK